LAFAQKNVIKRIQDPKSGIWDPKSKIQDLGSGIRDLGSGIRKKHILDPRSRGLKGVGSISSTLLGRGWTVKSSYQDTVFPFYHKKTEYSSVGIQITEEIIMDPDQQSRNPDLWIRIQ
jgi:hypothetical protein